MQAKKLVIEFWNAPKLKSKKSQLQSYEQVKSQSLNKYKQQLKSNIKKKQKQQQQQQQITTEYVKNNNIEPYSRLLYRSSYQIQNNQNQNFIIENIPLSSSASPIRFKNKRPVTNNCINRQNLILPEQSRNKEKNSQFKDIQNFKITSTQMFKGQFNNVSNTNSNKNKNNINNHFQAFNVNVNANSNLNQNTNTNANVNTNTNINTNANSINSIKNNNTAKNQIIAKFNNNQITAQRGFRSNSNIKACISNTVSQKNQTKLVGCSDNIDGFFMIQPCIVKSVSIQSNQIKSCNKISNFSPQKSKQFRCIKNIKQQDQNNYQYQRQQQNDRLSRLQKLQQLQRESLKSLKSIPMMIKNQSMQNSNNGNSHYVHSHSHSATHSNTNQQQRQKRQSCPHSAYNSLSKNNLNQFQSQNIGMISPMRPNFKSSPKRPKTVFKTMPPSQPTSTISSSNGNKNKNKNRNLFSSNNQNERHNNGVIVIQSDKQKLFFSQKKVKSIMKKESIYQSVISQMNNYFVKKGLFSYVSSNPNSKHFPNKKKQDKLKRTSNKIFQRSPDGDYNYNFNLKDKGDQISHLDIRGLIPRKQVVDHKRQKSHSSKQSLTQNTIEQDFILNQKYKSTMLTKYNSVQQKRENQGRIKTSQRLSVHKVKRSVLPFQGTWCFGRYKNTFSQDQIAKLKIMYYKDFIWKIQFDNGLRYQIIRQQKQKQEQLRDKPLYKIFVGNGNNSRLIKAIFKRRWWWNSVQKQQSANFVWTQLKISSIYQTQKQHNQIRPFPIKRFPQNLNPYQQCNFQSWQSNKLRSQDKSSLVLVPSKFKLWTQYRRTHQILQRYNKKLNQNINHRKILQNYIKVIQKPISKIKMTNHLEYSKMIGNKKALYWSMNTYAKIHNKELPYIPLTFHLIKGLEDQQYMKFLPHYYKKAKQGKTVWILKPGQLSNRGNGIIVCQDLQQIKKILKNSDERHQNGTKKTFILQEYINKPLLYRGRKFDLRHYIMITSNNGRLKGYFFKEGYVRTTSYKYSLKDQNPYVHLTNDAVQRTGKDYGKYQKGNKISYQQLDEYLKQLTQGLYSFQKNIYPQIKKICTQVIEAAFYQVDPKRRQNNFQIFGMDIMIDQNIKPYLIQVNTNPCLVLSSPLLARIIPKMLDNAFMIALDPIFPPPLDMLTSQNNRKLNISENTIMQNEFELVFDQTLISQSQFPNYLIKEDLKEGNINSQQVNLQQGNNQQSSNNNIQGIDLSLRQIFAEDQESFESDNQYQTDY